MILCIKLFLVTIWSVYCERELLGDFVLSKKVLYDIVVMSNDVCFKTFPILVKVWNINDRIVKDVWNERKFMWEDRLRFV